MSRRLSTPRWTEEQAGGGASWMEEEGTSERMWSRSERYGGAEDDDGLKCEDGESWTRTAELAGARDGCSWDTFGRWRQLSPEVFDIYVNV